MSIDSSLARFVCIEESPLQSSLRTDVAFEFILSGSAIR
jgi:hypothetical protein